jgi:hypothetical protein
MKKTLLAIAAICVAVTFQAQAHLVDLGITTGQPASLVEELARLNGQIDAYNALNPAGGHAPLPDAVLAGAFTEDLPDPTPTSYTIDVTGWDYLVMKWGNKNQHYYIGDLTGDQTFNSTVFNKGSGAGLGLSGYSLFNPGTTSLPDGGASLMLLGASLGALGLVRRFVKR